jgi:hypothetical protein
MENSTPFDLNQALSQWRASLQNLGGFHAEELEELEGHLRESISILHAKGLPVQEAFLISTRRLGSERQLSAEFAKANPRRPRTQSAKWRAAGVLVASTLRAITAPFSNFISNCGRPRRAIGDYMKANIKRITTKATIMVIALIAVLSSPLAITQIIVFITLITVTFGAVFLARKMSVLSL